MNKIKIRKVHFIKNCLSNYGKNHSEFGIGGFYNVVGKRGGNDGEICLPDVSEN